jgi:ketosteroid isomerase-like protein
MVRKYAAVTTIVMAIAASGPLRAPSDETDRRRQVLATDDRRIDALRRGDAAPLRNIYADDYTLITPAGVIRSKTDQINELRSGRLRQQVELVERTVRLYGDVAVVVSREKSNIVLAGRQVGGDMRMTRVYKQFGTEWRVIATHGSLIAP